MKQIKNDNLIKNSAVVAISNKISLLQRKIFNFLIAFAYIDLKQSESYTIDLTYLKLIVWFNSKNMKYIKDALRTLAWTVVDFNLLWKDKESWSTTALLASAEIEDGKCTYSFSPVMRKRLSEPNIYAKIKLSTMKLFSSKYSLCLYEIFLDYHNIWQTPIIPLSDFRKLMGLDEYKYQEFKRLSARVIKPAIKELYDVWWYKVEIEYKKENKRIIALKFYFEEIKKPKKTLADMKVFNNLGLQDRLVKEFWLTTREANMIIKTYPIPYIKESLDLIKFKINQKLIKNIPAYTITVLKNDYVPPIQTNTSKWDIQRESLLWDSKTSWETRQVKVAGDKTTALNDLPLNSNSSCLSKDQKEAHRYFESLSKEKKKKLIKIFEEEKITSPILKNLYKTRGLDDITFQVMFFNYIEHHLKI